MTLFNAQTFSLQFDLKLRLKLALLNTLSIGLIGIQFKL